MKHKIYDAIILMALWKVSYVKKIVLLDLHADEATEWMKRKFMEFGASTEAFCTLEYLGIKTVKPPTSFQTLADKLRELLKLRHVRCEREPAIIFQAFKVIKKVLYFQIILS